MEQFLGATLWTSICKEHMSYETQIYDWTLDTAFRLLKTSSLLIFFRIPCALKGPFVNLVLLRTHRTGSGTLANILYRYGDLNDLDFALPKQKSYDFYWPLHFNPSYVDKKYLNSTAPNLLINARYSPDTIASFMPKVTNTCLIQTQIIMQPLGNSGDRGWLLYAPLCIP